MFWRSGSDVGSDMEILANQCVTKVVASIWWQPRGFQGMSTLFFALSHMRIVYTAIQQRRMD
jgi:hypothetical protein